MKNRYHQQLMPYYKEPSLCFNKCNHLHKNKNTILGIQNETGAIRLYIIDQASREPISYATITVYVTDGAQRDLPIMHLVTTINPARIELPMATEIGTHILGPEYEFSTYNVSIDVFGYFTHIIYDIRLFPNTTAEFTIELVPVTQVQLQPIIERRIEIPPHPRDELIDTN